MPSTLIHAITQTRDGYLWLGTSDGLVRFDGINFVHRRLFSEGNLLLGPITALCATQDGALWMGSSSGVVMRMSGALRQQYRLGFEVQALAEASPGGVWAVTQDGLYRFENEVQGDLALQERIDPIRIAIVLDSRMHPLPLNASSSAQTRATSPAYSRKVSVGGHRFFLNRDKKGAISIAARPFSDFVSSSIALRDSHGFLWTANSTPGVTRAKDDARESVRELETDLIECLFEDREGNVWIGTNNGVFAFRFGKVSRMTARDGISTDRVSSVETTGSIIWVGTETGLNRIDNMRVMEYLPGLAVYVVRAAQENQVWAATQKGVYTLDAKHQVTKPTRIITDLTSVIAIESGAKGCVWLVDAHKGLYLWKNGSLISGGAGKISAIRAQNDGTLWIGFSDGRIGLYKAGRLEEVPLTRSRLGTVYDIYVENGGVSTHDAVWFATETGLYRYKEKEFTVWNSERGLPGDRVLWLEPDRNDALWLGFSTGVARVRRADLSSQGRTAFDKITCDFFDSADGVVADPIRRFQAAAAFDNGGKLWFTTSAGLAIIDARHIEKNLVPPPVVVDRVVADNRDVPAGSSPRLPALTKNLEIDYDGLSFVEPRKVQFRYRLEGFDKQWQSVGTRRQAFYTNLQPGTYRFYVAASNNDGVWSERAATLNFSILPAFYQTRLFALVCAIAGTAIVWGIYKLRLQQIQAALKGRFEERLSERTRIAQELHDELLQSAMGVSLQIELMDTLVDQHHAAKTHLVRALMLSRTLLQKGREVLRDLREKTRDVTDITKELSQTIEQVQRPEGPESRLIVEGQPRAVNPVVAEDFVQIGCEAIRNAFRHAAASKVDVYLIYKQAALYLEVDDNGGGIEPQIMQNGIPGHYGLTGMRERAERIGATLTVASRVKEGTKIAVSVPAKHAYVEG